MLLHACIAAAALGEQLQDLVFAAVHCIWGKVCRHGGLAMEMDGRFDIKVCPAARAGMTGYIVKATLSSTMGRAVPVTLPSLQQAVIAAAAKRPVSF
jgi:hypothetical protein